MGIFFLKDSYKNVENEDSPQTSLIHPLYVLIMFDKMQTY